TCSSDSSSPGATITARAAPTGAFCPSATSNQRRMPVAGASTSFVAFSLSICAMDSPSWTESPGRLSHSTTSPVFIDSPHLGMLKIVATVPLLSDCLSLLNTVQCCSSTSSHKYEVEEQHCTVASNCYPMIS